MNFDAIKAFAIDTGGTVLDWHSGFAAALSAAGAKHGVDNDWHAAANQIRRRSMALMINHGSKTPPTRTMDDAHRMALDEIAEEFGLSGLSDVERHNIAHRAPYAFRAWPDVEGGLERLRQDYFAVSFTILSYRMIMETARRNGLTWDAVLSCEGIGKYKTLRMPYIAVAGYLQLDPSECCMVACHKFDLEAAQSAGYHTAFVRRPTEWGPDVDYDEPDLGAFDLVVENFEALADAFDV